VTELTAKRLHDMAAFSGCRCECSQPNMGKARQYIADLLVALRVEKQDCMRYLKLLEFKNEREYHQTHDQKAFDAHDTAESTMRDKQHEIDAISEGLLMRGR